MIYQPGFIYFSPDMVKIFDTDTDFMQELIDIADNVMSRDGGSPDILIAQDIEARKKRRGLAWYRCNSSHGEIVMVEDVASGDIYNLTGAEYDRREDMLFLELEELPQFPQNARNAPRTLQDLF